MQFIKKFLKKRARNKILTEIYWSKRRHLQYYKDVQMLTNKYHPAGGTLLDVGGGIQLGCRYLENFKNFSCTSVETKYNNTKCNLDNCTLILKDFAKWKSKNKYDVVLCLQVLEHINDVESFTQKLFEYGKIIIISVPYKWEKGYCKSHVHDPVDEKKILLWTKRNPTEILITDKRLIAVYKNI